MRSDLGLHRLSLPFYESPGLQGHTRILVAIRVNHAEADEDVPSGAFQLTSSLPYLARI